VIKVTDYRDHALECRRQARQSTFPFLRDEFLRLAEAWDQLAEQREQEIAKGKITRAQPSNSDI
jgi:hypothetical protein